MKKNHRSIQGNQAQSPKSRARKTILSRSSKLVLTSAAYQIIAVGVAPILLAQPNVVGVCVNPIAPPPSSQSSSGSGYQPPAGPTEAEIAAQQAHDLNQQGNVYFKQKQWKLAEEAYRSALQKSPYDSVIQQNLKHAEAAIINAQGLDNYNNENWKLAAEKFKAALEKWPDNETIQNNYQNASSNLAYEEAKIQRQKQDASAAADIRENVKSFTSSLKTSPVNLGFDDKSTGSSPKAGGGLDFIGGNFDLHDAPNSPGQKPRTALEQIKSADALRGETAPLFDEGKAPYAGSLNAFKSDATVVDGRPTIDLDKLPDSKKTVQNNPDFKKMSQERQGLQNQAKDLTAQLLAVRQKMDASGANRSELAVQAATLKANVLKAESDLNKKEKDMRSFVIQWKDDDAPQNPKPSSQNSQQNPQSNPAASGQSATTPAK
jgi:DNA repair exonuclease SbcCD ATPase subunit